MTGEAPEVAPGGAAADALAKVFDVANERMSDPAIADMNHGNLAATAIGLAETLESMEKGETTATPVQRAFLSGALAALRGVLIAEQV